MSIRHRLCTIDTGSVIIDTGSITRHRLHLVTPAPDTGSTLEDEGQDGFFTIHRHRLHPTTAPSDTGSI